MSRAELLATEVCSITGAIAGSTALSQAIRLCARCGRSLAGSRARIAAGKPVHLEECRLTVPQQLVQQPPTDRLPSRRTGQAPRPLPPYPAELPQRRSGSSAPRSRQAGFGGQGRKEHCQCRTGAQGGPTSRSAASTRGRCASATSWDVPGFQPQGFFRIDTLCRRRRGVSRESLGGRGYRD